VTYSATIFCTNTMICSVSSIGFSTPLVSWIMLAICELVNLGFGLQDGCRLPFSPKTLLSQRIVLCQSCSWFAVLFKMYASLPVVCNTLSYCEEALRQTIYPRCSRYPCYQQCHMHGPAAEFCVSCLTAWHSLDVENTFLFQVSGFKVLLLTLWAKKAICFRAQIQWLDLLETLNDMISQITRIMNCVLSLHEFVPTLLRNVACRRRSLQPTK
jgi:hypothetical protein